MPITYGQYTKQVKLLPLTIRSDGTATICLRWGFSDATGEFTVYTESTYTIDEANVSAILDAEPTSGMTRRDDLSLAIYSYLVTNGLVEAGTVS